MFFTIGFGPHYNKELLSNLSKAINGKNNFKLKSNELSYCLDARDIMALDETFTTIAGALINNDIDKQIKEFEE